METCAKCGLTDVDGHCGCNTPRAAIRFGAGYLAAHPECWAERYKRIDTRPGSVQVQYDEPNRAQRASLCYFCGRPVGAAPGNPWEPASRRKPSWGDWRGTH